MLGRLENFRYLYRYYLLGEGYRRGSEGGREVKDFFIFIYFIKVSECDSLVLEMSLGRKIRERREGRKEAGSFR